MRNANCKLTLKCIFSVQFIRVLPSSIPFYEDFACFLFRIIEWICDLCRSGSEYRFVAVHCTSNKLYPLHRIKCPFQCNKITRMCVTCAASDVALRREQNPITLMKRTPKRTKKKKQINVHATISPPFTGKIWIFTMPSVCNRCGPKHSTDKYIIFDCIYSAYGAAIDTIDTLLSMSHSRAINTNMTQLTNIALGQGLERAKQNRPPVHTNTHTAFNPNLLFAGKHIQQVTSNISVANRTLFALCAVGDAT